jgi:hypothetical protein
VARFVFGARGQWECFGFVSEAFQLGSHCIHCFAVYLLLWLFYFFFAASVSRGTR